MNLCRKDREIDRDRCKEQGREGRTDGKAKRGGGREEEKSVMEID